MLLIIQLIKNILTDEDEGRVVELQDLVVLLLSHCGNTSAALFAVAFRSDAAPLCSACEHVLLWQHMLKDFLDRRNQSLFQFEQLFPAAGPTFPPSLDQL